MHINTISSNLRKRSMFTSRITLRNLVMPLVSSAIAGMLLFGAAVQAEELPDGTVISKLNIDKIKNDTFMGHTVGSLLTETMEWQIRSQNLTLPLIHSPEPTLDPKFWEATKKYSGQVKFDPQTREVTGYEAGLPFPNIVESDPSAGDKIMWNAFYGFSVGKDLAYALSFITVGSRGFEANSTFAFERIDNKGRLGEDKATLNDPSIRSETIFVGVAPQDVKGVGTFVIRYDVPGKFEDTWAYIKSARRTRRLSGSAWMDPVGGFDFLQDDSYIYNARPSQYKQNKLIGKRWILAVTDFKGKRDLTKIGGTDEWDYMRLKDAPYWNPVLNWTPREVWVVEGTPPPEHPYSKKIIYMDAKIPAIYRGESFDKKGEIWRVAQQHFANKVGESSNIRYFLSIAGEYIDFQAKHATIFAAGKTTIDRAGVKWADWSIEGLERPRSAK